jgi:hypothetical protein
VPDDPPPQAATHVLSRPVTMSRARFELLRGIVDGTGDDRSMDTSLILLDISDISWLVACDCAMQQESNRSDRRRTT